MIRSTARTARRARKCQSCLRLIREGERYLEHVASPRHGDLGNETWWRTSECRLCAQGYGRPIPLTEEAHAGKVLIPSEW